MRSSEQFMKIPVLEPVDAEAGIDGQSINMGLLHSVTFPIVFGAITGDAVLKFYAGATDGAKTTALAFRYQLSAADFKAASADLYGASVSVASTGLTLTAAAFDHRTIVVEFDTRDMPVASPWLTVELSAAASVLLVACVADGEGRYMSSAGTTVV